LQALAETLLTLPPGALERVPLDAGLLVAPGERAALAGALRRAIGDPALRRRLAAGARRARETQVGWDRSTARFARAVVELSAP